MARHALAHPDALAPHSLALSDSPSDPHSPDALALSDSLESEEAFDSPERRAGGWGSDMRRASMFLREGDLNMNITSLFNAPDNSLQQTLIILVPHRFRAKRG